MQERGGLLSTNVAVWIKVTQQIDMAAGCTQCHCAQHTDFLLSSATVGNHRRFCLRSPSLLDAGVHHEAHFVSHQDNAVALDTFFKSAGQSSSRQASIL